MLQYLVFHDGGCSASFSFNLFDSLGALNSILINTIENQLIFTSMKNVLNRCDHFILYISSFIIIGMAFVSRGQRQTNLSKSPYIVGPGSYEMQVEKESKIPKAFVPFGSMEPRLKDINYKEMNLPGPGSYNVVENQTGQKIVVSSETEDIKILEISRPNPVFKSGTQRFKQVKEEDIGPGPGQYISNLQQATRKKNFSTNTNSNQKPKIIEHLMAMNKYQSIPSIPSNIHAYGYNENQNNELELNDPPLEVYKGEKEDKVGPGQYNLQKQRTKGTSLWSQAKEKRLEETKSNVNIGPGSYDPKQSISLYNYKPTVGFISKTLRTQDQRKGAIVNEKVKKQSQKIQKIIEDNSSVNSKLESRVISEKAPPSTRVDEDSDDEYEYIDETTPGPGSYLQMSEVKKFKPPRKGLAFGVSEKRFAIGNNGEVGPGTYNNMKSDFKKKKEKKISIPKKIDRFPQLTNKKKVEEPGPGSYEPRNTMEDKLIYKIQRGYRGQFGSTEIRSKDPEDQELPGPADYDPKQVEDQKQALSVFKSKSNRKGLANKNNVPAPGIYSTNLYDISTKIIKEEEEDPDLIIKKPGFGVGEKRFKDAPKKQDQFDDDDIIKQIQDKHREEKKKKMLKNSVAFKSNEPRLKDAKKDIPGPGSYYDGEEDHWNKRTYNILFADI